MARLKLKTTIFILISGFLVACGNNGSLSSSQLSSTTGDDNSSSGISTPDPTPTPSPSPSPTVTPTPTTSPTPGALAVAPIWEAAKTDGKLWTAHVMTQLEVLGDDLLDVIPADGTTFCPKYNTLTRDQRKNFWVYLLSQMTKYESSFNTNLNYTENFNDSSGNNVISAGLLQLSVESGNAYGCGLKSTSDLHDPYKNLSCGIRILNRWMGKDARIAGQVSGSWKGGARYWAVLRSTNAPYAKIVAATKAISICK
ncbi:transglycosylase SLT domain-containing protein [Bdellovibrio sp. KM01]|uniref:transglycosylase SLT domain-containing protein n=1 Tax=Bdellovibrio sp. KM01 TaxID=2748865 RepID=UPI0015EAC185|nr:transglycosylase SLT domain-containing protein [Bdellovibrio sp. KM01]QLY26931.1 transglycosylase SLT domain-containing protein [Bdellovibrio sp. KM01]